LNPQRKRTMLRGVARLRFRFTLTMAAYDLLSNFLGSPPGQEGLI
jgi:hypothetical protein